MSLAILEYLMSHGNALLKMGARDPIAQRMQVPLVAEEMRRTQAYPQQLALPLALLCPSLSSSGNISYCLAKTHAQESLVPLRL